jgi:D-alanyl-D-alanine carboxypeptidase (penicillin-binding protein 5/6)
MPCPDRPGRTRGLLRCSVLAGTCSIVLAAILLSGCGRGGATTSATDDPAFEAPSVVFAGKPLEIAPPDCVSSILLEPETNTVLYEHNSHERRAPGSIAKMMLELVVMREIEAGRLSLADSIRTSAWASRMGGSQVYLSEGETFTLEDMLKAIAIASANDACVAVAEHLAGTTSAFVSWMNREAQDLGLKDTVYRNVHGLDDEPGEGNETTAYDVAQLGRELIRYPEILGWSSTPQALFRDGQFVLENTNRLVGHFDGLDGLKTGYTAKAGFCLCATASRNGMRLISVVLGCDSNRGRARTSAQLLGEGFAGYVRTKVCGQGESQGLEMKIPHGNPATIQPVPDRDLTLFVSRPDDRSLETRLVPDATLEAPLAAWQRVGTLQVISEGTVVAEVPVLTPIAVEGTGLVAWFKRIVG